MPICIIGADRALMTNVSFPELLANLALSIIMFFFVILQQQGGELAACPIVRHKETSESIACCSYSGFEMWFLR